MRDFTLEQYRLLCEAFTEYDVCTVAGYLEKKPQDSFIILRHDVDRSPLNALRMAELESELDICSTYYFRYNGTTFIPNIIKKIRNLGHEIGYHYEVLSKCHGDYESAITLFEYELNEFKKIANISTISMHGKPMSKYNNMDLWNFFSLSSYDLFEAFSIDIPYISDSGRNWGNDHNIRDYALRPHDVKIKSTNDLMSLLLNSSDSIYISVHPERWNEGVIRWSVDYVKDFVFNIGKHMLSGVI